MGYLRKIDHATSVKEIFLLKEPTNTERGVADFKYRPVFSVFDYGTIVPPEPLDNSTVNLMLGFNFELLRDAGLPTHYISLVTDKGEEVSVKDVIARKLTPIIARVEFANRIMPEFKDGTWDYSAFHDGEIKSYVQPIEFISRNDLPGSSSVWKRIKKGQLSITDLGLPANFKQGDAVPKELIPILDYSTKFEPEDRYLSPAQTQEILGMTDEQFAKINDTTRRASNLMTMYAASRGFQRLDGKVEFVDTILGDAVCTWHEDKLVTPQGLGISKQRIRSKVKELNLEWYESIEAAKDKATQEGIEDFRTLIDPNIEYVSPSIEFFKAINQLFQAGTNQWIDAKVYPVFSNKQESLEDNLARAVEEFKKVA